MEVLNENTPNGENLISERMNSSHFSFMLDLLNDPETARLEGREFVKYDMLSQMNWYNENHKKGENDFWVFKIRSLDKPVGYLSCKLSDGEKVVGRIGIKVSSDYRGCGFGKEILSAAMDYYFTERRVNKLISHIIDYNKVSQSLFLNSFNWRVVSVEKEAILIKSQHYDLINIEFDTLDYENFSQTSLR